MLNVSQLFIFSIRLGLKCSEIHSHLSQINRERALNDFRSGKIPILLATDMAARGIHVNNVEYVINYDFPTSLEQVRTLQIYCSMIDIMSKNSIQIVVVSYN